MGFADHPVARGRAVPARGEFARAGGRARGVAACVTALTSRACRRTYEVGRLKIGLFRHPERSTRVGTNAPVVRRGYTLLVALGDASGFRYNLPGGGVEAGESVPQALTREEIAAAHAERYGAAHKLTLTPAATSGTAASRAFPAYPARSRWV